MSVQLLAFTPGEVFECSAGGDIANVGGGSQRCDEIGTPYARRRDFTRVIIWLNPASFTTIPYTFGTESRNNLVGPSYKDVDFSAFKDFPVTERAKLQFRAEFFNLFNHTNFQNPTNDIQSSAFGGIFGSNFAREIQVAAKLIF